jgi:signal transduction histidine kinase
MTGRRQPFQEVVIEWRDAGDGQRYLSISGQPIFGSEGQFKGYRGVAKDVTDKIRFQEELARSNAALRELSEAQQAFREAERKRIARELHDELAQLLATSRMELCLLQRDLKPASATHQRLDTVDRIIGSSIISLRKLATDLRPSSLDEGELFYALRSMLKTVSENAGIECDLIASEADLVMDEVRGTAIFRLIEECITNVGRHANAKKAVIQLHRCSNAMEIRVQDDGRGIRQEEMQQMNAVGLIEMRERVRKMNGRLDIRGLPGKGTRIAVSLPHFFEERLSARACKRVMQGGR